MPQTIVDNTCMHVMRSVDWIGGRGRTLRVDLALSPAEIRNRIAEAADWEIATSGREEYVGTRPFIYWIDDQELRIHCRRSSKVAIPAHTAGTIRPTETGSRVDLVVAAARFWRHFFLVWNGLLIALAVMIALWLSMLIAWTLPAVILCSAIWQLHWSALAGKGDVGRLIGFLNDFFGEVLLSGDLRDMRWGEGFSPVMVSRRA